MLRTFYTKYVLDMEDVDDNILKNYCTKRMIKYLYDAFQYEGEGIAIWEFRGSEGGELLNAKFTQAIPLGNGKFRVRYTNGSDNEIKDSCDVMIIEANGKMLIDEIIKYR